VSECGQLNVAHVTGNKKYKKDDESTKITLVTVATTFQIQIQTSIHLVRNRFNISESSPKGTRKTVEL